MSDKGDAPGLVLDLGRGPVAVGAGRVLGPARPRSGQPPADEIDDASRLCAVGIKEARAVEMVRHRAGVITRHRSASENPEECGGGECAQRSNDPAARNGHPRSQSIRTVRLRLLGQSAKLVPQPQDALAFGLLTRNEAPIRSSTKSISEPARNCSET